MPNAKSRTNTPKTSPNSTSSTEHNQPPVPMVIKLLRLGFRMGGHLMPNTAGNIAYKLWFTPTRFNMPEREKEVLASAKIATHQIDDDEIVTFSWGQEKTDRPLVLLVHGWSGRGTQLGPFVQPLLDAGYRVLSFDAPAHGKSSGKQTNIYEVADVLVDLQKHYGEINAVITHSFGGPCIAAAMQRGFITDRIVSIAPPATTRGLVEKFNDALHVPKKAAKIMMQLTEKKYGENIWEEISMVNTIKTSSLPGLVIHDNNDSDIPWEEGEAVAKAWDNAQFIKTSGLGHRRILRDPAVIETSVAFIQG
jgi:pimeloyl-ACP methyl ester carboxylesterase